MVLHNNAFSDYPSCRPSHQIDVVLGKGGVLVVLQWYYWQQREWGLESLPNANQFHSKLS